MSKTMDDVLDDLGATLFCMGQDWKKGDGSASRVDTIVDQAKAQIYADLMALLPENKPVGMTPYENQINWARGYNEALSDVTKAITAYFKGE